MTRDEDVFAVGHVLEQALDVRKNLCPYMEPKTEVRDIADADQRLKPRQSDDILA